MVTKCKHIFKTLSDASGGWQSKNAIFQCTKCNKLFCSDGVTYWEITYEDNE